MDTGSGNIFRGCSSRRNPRLIEPSWFTLPRWSDSRVGDCRSDSGDPMDVSAVLAWASGPAGTTRFRRLMTDFFMVTGRWTP